MVEEVDRIIDEIHVKGIAIPGPFEYLFDEENNQLIITYTHSGELYKIIKSSKQTSKL
jgi:hypothetical protein